MCSKYRINPIALDSNFFTFIFHYDLETHDMIARQVNGKIDESEKSFIKTSTTTLNRRTDSSQSSPNSVKSTNGEKVSLK